MVGSILPDGVSCIIAGRPGHAPLLRLEMPADVKDDISRSMPEAASSKGKASAAPVPSPSRMPRLNSGSSPSASSSLV
jgi:hypothetical protein